MTEFRSSLKFAVAAALAACALGAQAQTATINYNRCDSTYDGIPVSGVEWQKPMPPSGKNDFGVFWTIKLDEFTKGRVNYIIHKGDSKEQGGRDMAFDGSATKEIWVNSGDRKIYTSLDDAKKAREAKPCS
jgi:hypothetical protein